MQGGRKLEARATPAAVRFPLHHAALQGDIERVRFLIGDGDAARRGMEMRADDEDDLGRTALHVAAAFGHVEICALFCGLDAAIVHKRAELMQGVYPLHLACAGGWEGDTFLSDDVFFDEHGLGDKGAAASGDSKSIAAGDAEMTEAQKKRLEVVMLLLENGADATARTSTGSSALHLTAGTGDLGCARKLIEYGADINCRDAAGRTPLYSAASNGQRRMIAFLLNARADASIATTSGESVLHAAALCSSTHPDTIDWLVSAGASMQGRKSDGKTPLMLASESLLEASVARLSCEDPYWPEDEEYWPDVDPHSAELTADGDVDQFACRRLESIKADLDVEAIKKKFGISDEDMETARGQLARQPAQPAESPSRVPSRAPMFRRTLSRSGSVAARTYM